ncbi:hypothetical protein ACIHFD_46510 [Nonomuraea sp. NPDC051941]|uniref:hypothetical protein n=1 Tax=Nonomuraea sp. NPDC051941 TaxID=3364373 RepID=UPI0037CC7311
MAEAGGGDGPGQDIARVGRILAQIVAPTTFIASVLMYIGTIRLNTMYSELGINSSMLSFPFQEYVMRSVKVADEPLAIVLLLLLMAPFVHGVLIRFTLWHRTALGWTILALSTLGAVSLAVAVAAMADWPRSWHQPLFVKPLFLSLGAILLVYSIYLYTTLHSGQVMSSTGQIVQRTALVALALLPMLWYMDDHAREMGKEDAKQIREHPEEILVAVVVYAPQQLNLEGPGIQKTPLTEPNAKFRYRYTGLRLLIESNQRYFVVPACWGTTPGARAIALPADGSIRLETLNVANKPSCS